jgi:hypothetical protein
VKLYFIAGVGRFGLFAEFLSAEIVFCPPEQRKHWLFLVEEKRLSL